MSVKRVLNVLAEIGPTIRRAGISSLLPRAQLKMPGESFGGTAPEFDERERAIGAELREYVHTLADDIGPRHIFVPEQLALAESYLSGKLGSFGQRVELQTYDVQGVPCTNYSIDIKGSERPDEIVVIGAHYDSVSLVPTCRAANDNASGVAVTMALAHAFASSPRCARTVRFVLFANEEPPFFWTRDMGSLVCARACAARGDTIVGMLTPETIGYYTDAPGSQRYPGPIARHYPDTGNFVAFAGMYDQREFVSRCVRVFREQCRFPCEGAALPPIVPRVGASDHWSFWKCGYPAAMVTDTAPYRYRYYHTPEDTSEKLDYLKMARVTAGLESVIRNLAA